ncbi:phosphoglycerate kinase [Mycoplasma feriruminatoris]|uniref:Phosphoglycerate kinase n=1 Tax=Mycoplasma feriruminatoris TaxID=1179777 RepID=A0A654IMA9_9MOLU|nr:phosphoglycerate kinase [Mycoplasma feriruminatoris]WFQ91672.1 Phosphoglycerate kinase [Mycoplasma feriruminatoris]WFQ94204.1 Phosphoglycerate kinase [Mycoplasma feriruminatoris]VZR99845.1 Phosphoglycerate kinase [Mycoplasma feriruminatoris]
MNYNNKKTLKDIDVKNKTVLVRVDFNVPIQSGVITDDNRIIAALPTINYLIENDAKIVLFSHLSRIKSKEDKLKKSLAPVAKRLEEVLNKPVKFVNKTRGLELEQAISSLQPKEIVLVENTRFEDVLEDEVVKYESKNNPELGKYWASLGEVFVNDAFGTAHRAHASNVGIASNIKVSAIGFLVEQELKMLSQAVNEPKKPFVAILGGAKVSDKIGVIENLLPKVDKLLIGGGMSYTFLKALGRNIGKSLLEEDKIDLAKHYLEIAKDKIVVPVDTACSKEFADVTPTIFEGNIPDEWDGLDAGPKTIELYRNVIKDAKTIVWNGPVGVFEFKNFEKGTRAVCQAIAEQTKKGAFTLIGGGDSASAAINMGFKDDFSWISTGGGASLEFMEGKELLGISAIQEK